MTCEEGLPFTCIVFVNVCTGNEGKPLSSAEAYDPVADKWSALPNMAVPLCSCSYVNCDGQLYVIGGLSVGGPSAAVELLSVKV